MRNRTARVLAALVCTVSMPFLGDAVLASAQAAQTPAPSCVYRSWWRSGVFTYIYVANSCGSHKYLKVEINWANDTCLSMWPGESTTLTMGRQASLSGVYTPC